MIKSLTSHYRITVVSNIILGLVYLTALILGLFVVRNVTENQQRAYRLEQNLFELTILSQDFLYSKSLRAAQQWHTKYLETLKVQDLIENSLNGHDTDFAPLIAPLRKNLMLLKSNFAQFEAPENPLFENLQSARQAQLSTNSLYLAYQATSYARQIFEGVEKQAKTIYILLLVFLVFLIALGKYATFWLASDIYRKTRKSLEALGAGIARLHKGFASNQLPTADYIEFSTVFRDVQKASQQIEAQYRSLIKKINHQKKQIEEASEAKSNFLANISHEIRTPLSIIDGIASFLNNGNEANRVWANKIRWNVSYVTGLINDILDLAKIESGKMEYHPKEVETLSIAPLFSGLQERAKLKDTRLSLSVNGQLPRRIKTDCGKLQQILMNIIGNSIKFTDHGEIQVVISFFENVLRFIVSDTGCGISLDRQQDIFSRFFQANANNKDVKGSGLGLALAKEMAKLLGGDVRLLNSTIGKGSTFEITIAVDSHVFEPPVSEIEFSKESPVERSTSNKGKLQGLKFLLAEDSEDLRKLTSTRIAAMGAEIVEVENGEEALGAIGTPSNDFDLVLMDIQMPVMDGYTAVKQLRESGYLKPVIACSARLMKEEKELGFQAGFSEYLEKPLNLDRLIDVCQELTATKDTKITSTMEPDENLAPLLANMCRNLQNYAKDLAKAVQDGEKTTYKQTLHKLKGILSSYGYGGAANRCAMLERNDNMNWQIIGPLLRDLIVISKTQLSSTRSSNHDTAFNKEDFDNIRPIHLGSHERHHQSGSTHVSLEQGVKSILDGP